MLRVKRLIPEMIRNTKNCIDPRGEDYLKKTLLNISQAMGCETVEEAADIIEDIFVRLELEIPQATTEQFEMLKTSVNPVRLKNHPVELTVDTIDMLYHQILKERVKNES